MHGLEPLMHGHCGDGQIPTVKTESWARAAPPAVDQNVQNELFFEHFKVAAVWQLPDVPR